MKFIWWTKVTNASHFQEKIISTIQGGQSVILQLPEKVPWYGIMRNMIETELIKQNSTSSYRYIIDTGADPGEYLFQEFCKKEKRAHYRPGIGYAEFLAKSEEIVLNECILWISGITKEQTKKWYSFVESYYLALGKKKRGCIFLIETRSDNNLMERRGIRKINYEKEIEHYDNYLFNMLAASSLKESELFKRYLAEAVSIMLPDDVELSSVCIGYGREFLNSPIQVIRNIVESESRSDGSRFVIETEENDMQERLWEAQIKVIFPLVEKHRNAIVQKYQKNIQALLPIQTAYGEVFEEAGDVELGVISYLAASGKIQMTYEDSCKVAVLKQARNVLAHIGTLSQEQVDEIFGLGVKNK